MHAIESDSFRTRPRPRASCRAVLSRRSITKAEAQRAKTTNLTSVFCFLLKDLTRLDSFGADSMNIVFGII